MSSAMITLAIVDLLGEPVAERIVVGPTIHDCLDSVDVSKLPERAVDFLYYVDRLAYTNFPRMGITFEQQLPGGTLLITVDAA